MRTGADHTRMLLACRGVLRAPSGPVRCRMPHLLDAARVHATEGEIVSALQDVFGSYAETPVF